MVGTHRGGMRSLQTTPTTLTDLDGLRDEFCELHPQAGDGQEHEDDALNEHLGLR